MAEYNGLHFGGILMEGRKLTWLACALATALVCGTSASGQESLPPDSAYPTTSSPYGLLETAPAGQNYLLANRLDDKGEATEASVDDRIQELEKKLAKMEEAEAAAKKKAASKPSVRFGGRLFSDAVLFDQDDASIAGLGDAQDSVYVRTARFCADGTMFDVYFYKLEADFAYRDNTDSARPRITDAYVGMNELPYLGAVQVGHFKEPFSLEELTSNRYITFMERSLANAFSPSRNMGVMASNYTDSERITWAAGVFRDMGDPPPYVADDDGGTAVTGRVTALPWYDVATEGRGLFHLGLSASYRDWDTRDFRIRQREEVAVGPRVVDTGVLSNVEDYALVSPEMAFVYGPFSIQSEYIWANVNRGAGFDDPTFHGVYVQTSYFLTGENRQYKRTAGVFDRVKPNENFFRVRATDCNIYTGKGAWEVAYRYSWIDLDDRAADVLGGWASDHTVGLNWYLNPYTRLMWNYIYSTDSLSNDGDTVNMGVIAMRAQIDF